MPLDPASAHPPARPQPRRREPHLIRPRSGLRTIRQYCEEMAAQERQSEGFHTLVAIDPDVVHMGAFPLENLAQGSVFHAWEPLRELSLQMTQAMRDIDFERRNALLQQIFGADEFRIPLLTTVALSTYLFERRGPGEQFGGYALLPPHQREWDDVVDRARRRANDFKNALNKRIDVDRIRLIVEQAQARGGNVAEALIDELPHEASTLFPTQLAPDHGIASCLGWHLGGVIRPYDKIPGLERFDAALAKSRAQRRVADLAELIRGDIVRSRAFEALDENARRRRLEALEKTIVGDARSLAFLEEVRSGEYIVQPTPEAAALPLRVILLTASARIWRVARMPAQGGLASACLRSPLSYLSDGRFFEWAFAVVPPDELRQMPLLQTLCAGLLSDWLTPLTADEAAVTATDLEAAHHDCVAQWERLASHLATSLNLASPLGGLRKAIEQNVDGDAADPVGIAALLQLKIFDASNRLWGSASEVGLAHTQIDPDGMRSLPPVRLVRGSAHRLLRAIAAMDMHATAPRLELLKEVMAIHVDGPTPEIASSYYRSLLISLLWYRLQHWAVARDVAEQAAAYALLGQTADAAAGWQDAYLAINGEEALYLVAVTARVCATDGQSLRTAKDALRLALLSTPALEHDLRFVAEQQALQAASLLFDVTAPDKALGRLGIVAIERVLAQTLTILDGDLCRRAAASLRVGVAADALPEQVFDAYATRYALRQLHDALGILFLFAHGASGARDDREHLEAMRVHAAASRALVDAEAQTAPTVLPLTDSDLAKTIRMFVDHVLLDGEAAPADGQRLIAERCRELRRWSNEPCRAPLDRRYMAWLAARFGRG